MDNINNKIKNVLVVGVESVKLEDLLCKGVKIVNFISSIMNVSNSEVRRVIKQGGLRYVKNGELIKFREEDEFFYGHLKFKYGKHRLHCYKIL